MEREMHMEKNRNSGLKRFKEFAIYTRSAHINNDSLLVPDTVLETLCLDLSISKKYTSFYMGSALTTMYKN